MLKLSNGSPITKEDKRELFFGRKPIPDAVFDAFIHDLLTFEQQSDFKAFYDAHRPLYASIVDRYIEDYEKYLPHEFLLSFLNTTPEHEYCINLMLDITNGNYGVSIGNKVYSNSRPYHQTRYGNQPDYFYDALYSTTLTVHEFAHSFINAQVARYRDTIAQIDLTPYAAILEELCYGDSLETLIDEHIIRAIECLYVKAHFPEYAEKYIDYNMEDGYEKLRDVLAILSVSLDIKKIIDLFR